MAIRWLLFDVGGVLCETDDATWPDEYAARWAGRLGMSAEEYRQRLESAALPDATIRAGVEDEFWRAYGTAVGADAEQHEAMAADFWEAYCGTVNTELLAFVRSLKGHLGLAILSNSTDGARREEEARFGFSQVFDPSCYSHEIGHNKPDRAAFDAALAGMGADPSEVVFIDNLAANVEAAARLGMRVILHTDTRRTLDELHAYVPDAR